MQVGRVSQVVAGRAVEEVEGIVRRAAEGDIVVVDKNTETVAGNESGLEMVMEIGLFAGSAVRIVQAFDGVVREPVVASWNRRGIATGQQRVEATVGDVVMGEGMHLVAGHTVRRAEVGKVVMTGMTVKQRS